MALLVRRTVIVLLAVAFALLPAVAKPHAKVIRLKFDPEVYKQVGVMPSVGVLVGKTFRVSLIGDGRPEEEREAVGEHVGRKWIIPMLTDDPVPEFIQASAQSALSRWGLTVLPQNADYVLALRVQRFFAREEDKLHQAEVTLFARLESPGGDLLWQGEVHGGAQREARPLQAKVYNEVLGEALVRALLHLVTTHDLQAAVARGRGGTAQARVPRSRSPIVPLTGGAEGAREGDETTIAPHALLAELARMQREGSTVEAMVAFVNRHTITPPPTMDDILAFRQAQLPDPVLRAFIDRGAAAPAASSK